MKILVTGGGTGGHIYPALAFVNYVKAQVPNAEFMYVGAQRGLENKIVPETGIPFRTLEIQGFKRKISLYNVKTVQLFLKSIRSAKKNFKRISTRCCDWYRRLCFRSRRLCGCKIKYSNDHP